jgi:hypothetical protein
LEPQQLFETNHPLEIVFFFHRCGTTGTPARWGTTGSSQTGEATTAKALKM